MQISLSSLHNWQIRLPKFGGLEYSNTCTGRQIQYSCLMNIYWNLLFIPQYSSIPRNTAY